MLVGGWSQRVVVSTAAVEEGTYPWEDGAPDLETVGLGRAFEEELVEAEISFDDGLQLTNIGSLFHLPDQALEFFQVGGREEWEGVTKGKALQGQADRDEHLAHLLQGDADHLGGAVGEGNDKPLLLQMTECLPYWSPTDTELLTDLLLDEPITRLEASVNQGITQGVQDALP